VSEQYYVYEVKIGDEVVYVGKGRGDRYLHATSGKSHNFKLNRFYFEHLLLSNPLPTVEIVAHFHNETRALKYEKFLISHHLPECNIRGKVLPEVSKPLKVGKVKVKPTKVKKVKYVVEDDCQDDVFISPIPEDIIGLEYYVKERYEDYLQGTTSDCPSSFRTFIKALIKIGKYSHVTHHLEVLWLSLPDNRQSNGGHNKSSLIEDLNLPEKDRKKFNNWKSYFRKTKEREPTEEECLVKLNKLLERENNVE
jgi:hypothetical protein